MVEQEFNYILEFIEVGELDVLCVMQQLRALWTSFCIRMDINVDTAEYDNRMTRMWETMQENGSCTYSNDEYNNFYNLMSKFIV